MNIKSNRGNAGLALLIGLVLILAIVFMPLVAMWAVDAVFGTKLPVTLKSWFGMLLLIIIFGGAKASASKS